MTDGHGDDAYKYRGELLNFSSNIYASADMGALQQYLCQHIGIIGNYPEPTPRRLEQEIARCNGIAEDCVLVTNGATDAIYLIADTLAHLHEGTTAGTATTQQPTTAYTLAERTTFSEYADACRLYGLTEHPDGSSWWLCNPNNPTGTVRPLDDIRREATRRAFVVVDQSYEDYTLAPMLTHEEAASSRNIIVIHSFTKTYAIPGLRLGYITAPPHIVSLLRRRVRPWAVNALAIKAGHWLLAHNTRAIGDLPAYLQEAQRLRQRLNGIAGITVGETQTNFILAHIATATAAELKDYLVREHGILIRDASNFYGLTAHHFRISAQRRCENDLLCTAIAHFVAEETAKEQ